MLQELLFRYIRKRMCVFKFSLHLLILFAFWGSIIHNCCTVAPLSCLVHELITSFSAMHFFQVSSKTEFFCMKIVRWRFGRKNCELSRRFTVLPSRCVCAFSYRFHFVFDFCLLSVPVFERLKEIIEFLFCAGVWRDRMSDFCYELSHSVSSFICTDVYVHHKGHGKCFYHWYLLDFWSILVLPDT